MMGCVSAILLFDSQKEKTKEAELDAIFAEILEIKGVKEAELAKEGEENDE